MKSKVKEEYICQNHLYTLNVHLKKSCCLVPRAQIRNIITVLFLMFWIYYDKFNQIYSKSFFLRREIFAFWATT